MKKKEQEMIAEAIRKACLTAALNAYEQAGISGLCAEGRWELAIDTLRNLDLNQVLEQISPQTEKGSAFDVTD